MLPKQSKDGCPCCVFLLDDLFLPPSLKSKSTGDDSNLQEDSMELPMNPKDAVEYLSQATTESITLIDSHGHAQLERDADENYTIEKERSPQGQLELKSITCAVDPTDWTDTLQFASKSSSILPALGVHPWYLEGLADDWLEELERLLLEHPSAIVGEIGLCKMARFVRQHPDGKAVALAMQRDVFKVSRESFFLFSLKLMERSCYCLKETIPTRSTSSAACICSLR